MRNIKFIDDEYYHIYNRGVDRRNIFTDKGDLFRFLDSLIKLNTEEPLGGLYEIFLNESGPVSQVNKQKDKKPLVHFIAYCINPNHYHFILKQAVDDGIPRFMHRISAGYTRYFNEKYKRTGSLFSGRYKAKHIDSDDYLLNVSAYVNLNYLIHGIDKIENSFVSSSWDQYVSNKINKDNKFIIPCDKESVLEQAGDPIEYKKFAEEYKDEIINTRAEEDKDGFINIYPSNSATTNS